MIIDIPGSISGRRTLFALIGTGKFRPWAEGFDNQGSLRTQYKIIYRKGKKEIKKLNYNMCRVHIET